MSEYSHVMRRGTLWIGVAIGAFLLLMASLVTSATQTDAAGTVLIRGVVKPGGATDSVNVYISHVAEAPDASAIRGIRTDVKVSGARKMKWIEEKGELKKVTTTANPVPEKEVVVRGTLDSDNRITASWIVQNYREFTLQGTLQERELDTGFTDQGWVTINVTSSKFRDVVPPRGFKETIIKGKDLRVRVNGSTSVSSLGSAKSLEEVNAGQQKVKIEGQMNDEYVWVASDFKELNE